MEREGRETREADRKRKGSERRRTRRCGRREGRRWCSRKAIGGGDGSVEQKGCGGCGKGETPMEENGGVAAAG